MSHEKEKEDEAVETTATTSSSSKCKEDVIMEEQRNMFGSDCIVTMFDTIHDQIEHVMNEGITTLPYLPTTTTTTTTNQGGKEALLQIIQTSYRTNMDLAELYALRNIFTIPSHYTKLQRQQILKHYWNQLNTNTTTTTTTTDSTDISNTNIKETIPQPLMMMIPPPKNNVLVDLPKSMDEIPSQNDLNVLDQEILELQSKLQNTKERQMKNKMKLQTIQEASKKAMTTYTRLQQIVTMTNNTNTTSTSDGFEQVQESINTAILGQEALKDLCVKGTQLNQQMDDIQTQRDEKISNHENDTINLETAMKHIAKEVEEVQKRKNNTIPSLDDDMKERKKRIKINIPTTKETSNETNNNDTSSSSSFTSILKLR